MKGVGPLKRCVSMPCMPLLVDEYRCASLCVSVCNLIRIFNLLTDKMFIQLRFNNIYRYRNIFFYFLNIVVYLFNYLFLYFFISFFLID